MIVTNTTDTKLVYRTKGEKYVLIPGVGIHVNDEKVIASMKGFYGIKIAVTEEPTESKKVKETAIKEVKQVVSENTENKEGSEDGEEGHDVPKDGTEENTDGEGPVSDNAPVEGEEASKELGENKEKNEVEGGADGDEPSDQQNDETPEVLDIIKGKSKKAKSQTKKAKNAKSSK